jgi:hypothetical protein
MDRFLARLERRIGRYAVPNLTFVVAAGMAMVFVLSLVRPEFENLLVLDVQAIKHGQIWRVFSYLFLPPPAGSFMMPKPIAMLFAIYFVWLIGTNLEREWGPFKLNAFYVVGMLGTTIAALLAGGAGNYYLNLSLFLAFATVFPDFQIMIFFIIPVRIKWLGIISAAMLGWTCLTGDWDERAAIAAAMGNYLLFFAGYWRDHFRGRNLRVRQSARRAAASEAPALPAVRSCSMCGARESDGADIRVCSCEKCDGKPRTLCLEHARNH